MELTHVDMVIRLVVALVLGAVIGFERELSGKEAGFRTYALVSLGSALVMLVSIQMYEVYKHAATVDPSRIAAQVVSGIGFLGAGAIIRFGNQGIVRGLTTAAGIWVASGIGLACGLGVFDAAIVTTFLTLVALLVMGQINRIIEKRKK